MGFDIEFAEITDQRFDCLSGDITLDEKKFTIRYKEIRDVRRDTIEEEKIQRKLHQIQKYLNDKLVVAPAEDSPQNIMNALNDDCLLQIFGALETYELCQAANVCVRFNGIAKQAFKSRYNVQKHRSLMQDLFDENITSLFQIELCLRTFGLEIRALHINHQNIGNSTTEILLRMCAHYCTKIEALQLKVDQWNAFMDNSLRRALPHLKQLKLRFISYERSTFGDIFVGDWPLEVLELEGLCGTYYTSLTIKLPNLIELHLRGCRDLSEQVLNQCLLPNPQIRKCELQHEHISASAVNLLPTYLPKCEELAITDYYGRSDAAIALSEWRKFKLLKSLRLEGFTSSTYENILTTLALGEVPLQVLSLRIYDENHLVEYITKLRNLRTVLQNAFASNNAIAHCELY